MSDLTPSDYCIPPESSLRQAADCINRNRHGIALVVDDRRRLLDTVTDGDLRRAILEGVELTAGVQVLRERKRNLPAANPTTAAVGTSRADLLRVMQQHNVRHLPLVNDEEQVVDLVVIEDLLPQDPATVDAVVMAGGFGTRLRPLTDETPKPMLPVGDRPLLEHTLARLREAGIHRVSLTTHFLKDKIRSHFGDGGRFGLSIDYVDEEEPLGTAGALGLLKPPDGPLLLINGDIITNVDFRSMHHFHDEHSSDMTVGVRQYDIQVPYGVVECEGSEVRTLREKPTYKFFVNAGVYLLEPDVFEFITRGERCDMPDLIRRLLDAGRCVTSFPITEYWLDIGHHPDYEQAQVDAENGFIPS